MLASAAPAEDLGTRVLIPQSLLARRPAATSAPLAQPLPYRAVQRRQEPPRPEDTVVGITFWRLRPVLPGDDPETRLLVLDEADGSPVEQIPERIETGSPVKPGERIRLSVEVPRGGFLYILDRELFGDETSGPAHLIYPNYQTPPGDNAVSAGRLVEVPDRRDRINSFKLVKSRADHVGETLVVLISPRPIPELTQTSGQPRMIDENLIGEWEGRYGVQIEHLELEGGAGSAITAAETRSGANRLPLQARDPGPQSIFRFRSSPGEPVLLKLPLRLAR